MIAFILRLVAVVVLGALLIVTLALVLLPDDPVGTGPEPRMELDNGGWREAR